VLPSDPEPKLLPEGLTLSLVEAELAGSLPLEKIDGLEEPASVEPLLEVSAVVSGALPLVVKF